VYHRPPGTDGIPNYTIESAKYNANVADVEQDLNLPRPIVAGGTGANNAHDAMIALSGEIASQVVTNYDSFPFEAGSFLSAPGATGEPIPGSGFYTSGICHKASGTSMVLEAYVYNQGGTNPVRKFTREKWVTWEPWKQAAMSLADLDARYVNAAGDQMTGSLTLSVNSTTTTALTFNDTAGGQSMGVGYGVGTGNANLFGFYSSIAGLVFTLTGSSGDATFYHGMTAGAAGATGTYYFGNSGTKYLTYDGANFSLAGGSLFSANSIQGSRLYATNDVMTTNGAGATGSVYFGNSGSKSLTYDGINFSLIGGALTTSGGITAGGNVYAIGTGAVISQNAVYAGYSAATGGTYFFGNNGSKYLQCDGVNFGLTGGSLQLNNPGASLDINTTTGVPPHVHFLFSNVVQSYINDNGGSFNIYSNGVGSAGMYIVRGGNSWTAISDARLPYKQTATPMTVLDKLDAIQLYENVVNDRPDMFAKAQELNVGFPHMVYPGTGPEAQNKDYVPTGMSDTSVWGVSYDRAGIAALQGLKELRDLVNALRAEIAELKAAR